MVVCSLTTISKKTKPIVCRLLYGTVACVLNSKNGQKLRATLACARRIFTQSSATGRQIHTNRKNDLNLNPQFARKKNKFALTVDLSLPSKFSPKPQLLLDRTIGKTEQK